MAEIYGSILMDDWFLGGTNSIRVQYIIYNECSLGLILEVED